MTTRIAVLVVLGAAATLGVLAFAVLGSRAQRSASIQVSGLTAVARQAMEAKFRTADVAGWQTGYAFDFS